MKIKHEVSIIQYLTGTGKKGNTWHAIQVADEDGYKYMLFGEKAKDYKENIGEIKEVEIEIQAYFNTDSKKTETIFRII